MKILLIAVAAIVLLALLPLGFAVQPAKATGPVSCTVTAPSGGTAPASEAEQLGPAQMAVVQAILSTAKAMDITRRGATIALQTAKQESSLDADVTVGEAVGSFQQIAPGPGSAYVGYDRREPGAAAKGFFTVLLSHAPGYDTDPRPNHDLAQVVQASGAGAGEYAKHWQWAEAVTAALYDGTGTALECADQSVSGPIPVQITGNTVVLPLQAGVSGSVVAASPQAAKAVGAALAWLGTTYAWGGGDANGPTKGTTDNGGAADAHGDFDKIGFDCSGLTLYAWAQAGVTIIRPSDAQLTKARLVVSYAQAQPGDLLFWGTHHVAMYLGQIEGQHRMVEAPQSGDVVKVSLVRVGADFRNVAARPGGST